MTVFSWTFFEDIILLLQKQQQNERKQIFYLSGMQSKITLQHFHAAQPLKAVSYFIVYCYGLCFIVGKYNILGHICKA